MCDCQVFPSVPVMSYTLQCNKRKPSEALEETR